MTTSTSRSLISAAIMAVLLASPAARAQKNHYHPQPSNQGRAAQGWHLKSNTGAYGRSKGRGKISLRPSGSGSRHQTRIKPQKDQGKVRARAKTKTKAKTKAKAKAVNIEQVNKDADVMHKALNRLLAKKRTVQKLLKDRSAKHVAALRATFNQKFGNKWPGGSLRGALNAKFKNRSARRVLGLLDSALSRVWRNRLNGDEGKVRANIEKVFQLSRQRDTNRGRISESDLMNQYEITKDNRIQLLVDGKDAFKAMFKDLNRARQTIHIAFFIFSNDKLGNRMAETLMAKARQGVEVRVMVDGFGSMQMLGSPKRKLLNKMKKAGVEVVRNHMINPLSRGKKMNHPDHRKIVLVDGKVGYTGGMNVGTRYITDIHDLMVRVEGSSVHQMQAEWMTGWMLMGGRVDGRIKDTRVLRRRLFPKINKAPGKQAIRAVQHVPGESKGVRKAYLQRINSAKKSIYIENPYMTSHKIQDALSKAARRGVKVHVVLPGENNHAFIHLAARARYPKMLAAGVKLYEYPGFNHGKVMVTDGKFVTIGSSNLDAVALRHVYEMNLNVYDKKFAKDVMRRVFKKDISKSKEVKAGDITTVQKVMGRFWNMFAYFI